MVPSADVLPVRRSLIACMLATALSSCKNESAPEITMAVDRDGPHQVSFSPKSAFAEYVELPGDRHELRIVLSENESSCEEHAPPGDDQAGLFVSFLTPPGQPPTATTYPWTGQHATEGPVQAPRAIPKAQVGRRTFLFPEGGSAKLTAIDLSEHGAVRGLLAFAFAGDAAHAATRVEGSFVAQICRYSPAPQR